MKKLLAIICFVAMAGVAMSQSAEQIISRMEAEMSKHDENEGIAMTIDIKMLILGTMTSRFYSLGDKTCIEASGMGKNSIAWNDGESEWNYDSESNKLEIKKAASWQKSDADDNMNMFDGIADGYDVKIDKETPTEWHICCKKSKSNPDKDAPKKMTLVIAKGTYKPVSLSASMMGINMTIRDITYGVTEKQVTFDPEVCPNATIVDNR